MILSITVMAHPARAAQAQRLAGLVGAEIVWDERNDEWDTGARALAAHRPDATHHLVLQDDAQPVPAFRRHAVEAISEHPREAISFYLGRSRPPQWQHRIHAATTQADADGAAWIAGWPMLHGVAIALPVDDILPLLEWATRPTLPYDERIGAWLRTRGRNVFYTWPSLVDHEDGPTLVQHPDGRPRTDPRKAWNVGTPRTWHTPVVRL